MIRKRRYRKQLSAIVIRNKTDKTAVVEVLRSIQHPKFKKFYRVKKKFMVHDPQNLLNVGDKVIIQECRPISKRKHWRLFKIIEKAKVV